MTKQQKMEVERLPSSVRITILCGDDYEAMQLYDKVIESAKAGHLFLTIEGITAEAKRDE